MSPAWLVAIAVPALVAAFTIEALRRSGFAARLVDRPNERSLHTVPTPRVGGLGVLAGAVPVAVVLSGAQFGVLLACAAALGALSYADDVKSLPIQVRLPGHCVAAGVAVLAIASPSPGFAGLGWMAALALAAALVWMTNLFNFMDGADGLAGGMAAIGFGTLAFAASGPHAPAIALACAALASASAGFLVFNFPPARVFLGDAGSIPLGFLAGSIGAAGAIAHAWPAWFPALVFAPFIVDASLTLLGRLARGERIWVAHREHAYQRLALAGWPRRRLALSAWALMAAVSASAVLALRAGGMLQCGILAFWVVALVSLVLGARHRIPPATDRSRGGERPGSPGR